MKFALVNGERQEAQPGLSGTCPGCGDPLVAKCGEVNVWHWAHRGRLNCDPWWEPETAWHRWWKNQFPVDWQEFSQRDEKGEMHRADVKTSQGWAIEFQYSFLNPEERRARDAFYSPNLVWVVSGLRRKTDVKQLNGALEFATPIFAKPPLTYKVSPEDCRLLKEWAGCKAPVFFDFGEPTRLWWLLPEIPEGRFITELGRGNFIQIHRGGGKETASDFAALLKDFPAIMLKYFSTMEHNRRVLHSRQMRAHGLPY